MSVKVDIKVNKTDEYSLKEKQFRQEASRLVSMANKRLKRIEEQGLTESPAYKQFIENGGQKFGIRGKSQAEVKQEVARMNQFLNQQTSTVRGTKKYLTNVANSVGIIKIDNFRTLQDQLNSFFRGVDKVKEYLKNSKEVSVAIGYEKIFEVVSNYVEEVGSDLDEIDNLVEQMAEKVMSAASYGKANELLDNFMSQFM